MDVITLYQAPVYGNKILLGSQQQERVDMTEDEACAWVADCPELTVRLAARGKVSVGKSDANVDAVFAMSHHDGTLEKCADVRKWRR